MERGEALGPPAGEWECDPEVGGVFLRPGVGVVTAYLGILSSVWFNSYR